mgnify:CR=1 FL=1
MKNQTYRMTMLFDFYGELLTAKQKEYFDLHYNADYSLGEIAEMTGISRQGVWDIIKRAEETLRKTEEKTGLIRRFHTMKQQLQQVREDAVRLREISFDLEHAELERLSAKVLESVDTLLKE